MRKLPSEPGVQNEYVLTERDVMVIAYLVDKGALPGSPPMRFGTGNEVNAVVAKLVEWARLLCAECGRRCPIGVEFEVTLPNGRVERWRLCGRCFELAKAAERDS